MAKSDAENSIELYLSMAAVIAFGLFFWLAKPGYSAQPIQGPEEKYALWQDIEQAFEAAGLRPEFIYAIRMAEARLIPVPTAVTPRV